MKRKSHALSRRQDSSSDLRPFESPSCVVYAIELDPSVMQDPDFAAKNRQWISGKPCFYIGMTSLSPDERFEQHRLGTKNVSRIAHQYGRRLRMDVVPEAKPTRRTWAMRQEDRLTRSLRASGFGAWKG